MSRLIVVVVICLFVCSVSCVAWGGANSGNGGEQGGGAAPAATTPRNGGGQGGGATPVAPTPQNQPPTQYFGPLPRELQVKLPEGAAKMYFSSGGLQTHRTPEIWREGQQVYVIVDNAARGTYYVQIKGRPYEAETRVSGQAPTGGPLVLAAPTTKPLVKGQFEILYFACGRYAGGQDISISVLEKVDATEGAKRGDQSTPATVHIEDTYQYVVGLTFAGSRLQDRKFTKAPTTPGGTALAIAEYEPGWKVAPLLTLSVFSRRRVVDEPIKADLRHLPDRFSVLLGTAFDKPFSTYYAGVGFEVSPYIALTYGWLSGDVDVLAPGFHVGDAIASNVDVPTVTRRRTEGCFAITIGTKVWNQIFK
jgi:hypothetical protein